MSGVRAFLGKPVGPEEVLASLKGVSRRPAKEARETKEAKGR